MIVATLVLYSAIGLVYGLVRRGRWSYQKATLGAPPWDGFERGFEAGFWPIGLIYWSVAAAGTIPDRWAERAVDRLVLRQMETDDLERKVRLALTEHRAEIEAILADS